MPSAAPSSRVASFIAEPAPARRAGTAAMIDAVIGDIDERDAGRERDHAEQHVRVRRVGREAAEQQRARRRCRACPNATARCAPNRALEPRRERRDDDHDRRDRQEAQRRAERGCSRARAGSTA